MKGIYLTEEGKKAIEDKIAELEKEGDVWSPCFGIAMDVYQEIISSATILPVEENWTEFHKATNPIYKHFKYTDVEYPNGVIIQPKK